jgi:hypothetical protein
MASSGSTFGSRWSHREVECLLAIWADDAIQAQLEKTLKNSDVFGRIRESMTLLWSMQRTLGDDVMTYVQEPNVARPQLRWPDCLV